VSADKLLSVEAALAIVRDHARPLPARPVSLISAVGRVLAQDVVADADSPPFTKALMDGYALRAGDTGERAVIEEILAGMVPRKSVGPGQASRIMTGAMVPEGADTVVPVERTRLEGERVHLTGSAKVGDNILSRGREMRAGEVLLRAGRVLRPQDVGLLATVGVGYPVVTRLPELGLLSTGDELVHWEQTPGPGQIRESNVPMLMAQAGRAGVRAFFPGHCPDDAEAIRTAVEQVLTQVDMLILSGGVSAGKRDLVPDVLAAAGVTAHFHKIALKPGKPLLFGTKPREGQPPVLVFGLPGNPVSSFVCFEVFVRPALAILAGRGPGPVPRRVPLAEPVLYRTDRPTYHPAALADGQVRLVPWFGSADLRGLGAADALVVIPAGDHNLPVGTIVEVLPLEEDARQNG
jgi:molybdopterin molybdotransferase